MLNKRGQEGPSLITTVGGILIVVFIIVVLILGFTRGWGIFTPWISSNNVNTIVTQCALACPGTVSADSNYDYCTFPRDLKAPDLPEENGKAIKVKKASCNFFAKTAEYEKYGIAECPTANCPALEQTGESKTCSDLGGEPSNTRCADLSSLTVTYEDLTSQVTSGLAQGQFCCKS